MSDCLRSKSMTVLSQYGGILMVPLHLDATDSAKSMWHMTFSDLSSDVR